MPSQQSTPSARQVQLLEAAYAYVLEHGLIDFSLRPLATAIGSSPRVLLFLFGSKDDLIRALLARARVDEVTLLDQIASQHDPPAGLAAAAQTIWSWLSASDHQPLLRLWTEAYAKSLVDLDGPWAGFARATVTDWLDLLRTAQGSQERDTREGAAQRTLVLATLRGCLLDLLATADRHRVDDAFSAALELLRP